jgi:hypothetical protein
VCGAASAVSEDCRAAGRCVRFAERVVCLSAELEPPATPGLLICLSVELNLPADACVLISVN